MAAKVYSIANDFPNQKVKPDLLQSEIKVAEPSLANTIKAVHGKGDEVTVDFDGPLTGPQEAAVDAVVAEHSGSGTELKFHESTTLFSEKKELLDVANWSDLGGVVTDPAFFSSHTADVFGRISCAIKTTGAGAEMRVVQDQLGVETLLTPTPVQLPDTNGAWTPFQFSTSVAPNGGGAIYRVEGRRAGSTQAEVKYVVISMMEAVQT